MMSYGYVGANAPTDIGPMKPGYLGQRNKCPARDEQ